MTSYDIIVRLPDTTAVPIDVVNKGSKPFKTHSRTATSFKKRIKTLWCPPRGLEGAG